MFDRCISLAGETPVLFGSRFGDRFPRTRFSLRDCEEEEGPEIKGGEEEEKETSGN